jgi:hypothetical protein
MEIDYLIEDAARHEKSFIRPLRMGGPSSLIARVSRLYLKEYLEGEEMLWGKAHADGVAQEACERIEAIMDAKKTSPRKSKK